MSLLTSLSPKGRIALGASILAFLVSAIVLYKFAAAPRYTTVMAGIDPAQTTQVTGALDKAGVAYELQNNGTAIAVKSGQETQANIALASAGVNGTAKQPGFELLDKQKLGASNFQQQIAYQRALEGQIANTIGQISGVGGAQVSLTLPKDQLFADESQPATAAVLLQGDSSSLDPGAVRGIANLVASSVQGLKTSNVTITDGSGSLLWPQGDGAAGGAGLSKVAAQSRYDAQLASQLDAMLASTLGPGKAHVQVHSDLNVDQATQEKLQYAKKGVPLTAKDETETLQGSGGGTGGVTGTTSNIPGYAQTTGANGRSNYKHTTRATDFGVDKTITKTVIAPGTVNRLDVALVVDKKGITPATFAALQKTVQAAAGIQTARGDTFSATQVAFAPQPTAAPAAGPIPPAFLGYLKIGGLALGTLLFGFFLMRHLRRREGAEFADEPSWLRGLEPAALPPGDTAGDAAPGFDAQEAARAIFANDPRAIALDELVAREPDKVAQQLRTWITEDTPS